MSHIYLDMCDILGITNGVIMKFSNDFKSSLLNSYKYDLFVKRHLALYSMYCSTYFVGKTFNENLRYYLECDISSELTIDEFFCCQQIFNSFRKRQGRLRKRIDNMITNNDCLFLHKKASESDIIKREDLNVNKNIFYEQQLYAIKIADIYKLTIDDVA